MKKKKYIVDGQVYEIPDDKAADFLKDFPHAKIQYEVEGTKYEIPHDKADAFETDMGLKKKPSSNGLPVPLGNGLSGGEADGEIPKLSASASAGGMFTKQNGFKKDTIFGRSRQLPKKKIAINPEQDYSGVRSWEETNSQKDLSTREQSISTNTNLQKKIDTDLKHNFAPSEESIALENEAFKQDAINRTAKRSGRTKEEIQKDIDEGKLIFSPDGHGNHIYARQPGAGEAFLKNLVQANNTLSDAGMIAYTKATGTPEELAMLHEYIARRKKAESEREFDLMDAVIPGVSEIRSATTKTKDLPTATPSSTNIFGVSVPTGELAGMAGGIVPDAALAAGTGGLGNAAKGAILFSKMYASSYGNKSPELYEIRKHENMANGMDEKSASIVAAKEASSDAITSAIPDAATNYLFFSGKLHTPVANNFVSVVKGAMKDAIKAGALGAGGSVWESLQQRSQGYNVDDWVDKMFSEGGDFAKMESLFGALRILKTLPKASQSAVKEFAVDPVIKPFVENYVKTLPEVQQLDIMKQLNDYETATKDARGVVPEEKMASIGGRLQKRKNRMAAIDKNKTEIKELEAKKGNLPESLHEGIDTEIKTKNEEIKSLQKEIGSVDKEIETINKKEGTGLEHEKDELTGEPIIPKDEPIVIPERPSEPGNPEEIIQPVELSTETNEPPQSLPQEQSGTASPAAGSSRGGDVGGFTPQLKSNGEPKVYYHSSDNDFNEFKGQDSEGYERKHSLSNRGIYFHEAPPQMAQYGKNKYEVHLDIKNPFIIDNKTYVSDVTNPYTGKKIEVEHLNSDDIRYLKEQGYDAVSAKYPAFQTVVFEPSQVKIIKKNGEPINQSLPQEQSGTAEQTTEIKNESTEAPKTEIPNPETQGNTANEGANKKSEPAEEGKGEGGGGKKPPVGEGDGEPEAWTAIRQAKLKEIDRVAKLYEKENKTTFPKIQRQALEQVANEYPDKTLHEAVKAKTEELAAKYDKKIDYNPTSKDLAVIQEFKRQTEQKANSENLKERLNSDDDIVRNSALLELENYQNDLLNVGKALHKREAGTAFGFRASESRMDADYGLQIRKMEVMKAQGGEKLSAEQEAFLKNQWEKEKDIMRREQEAREGIIKESFEQEIDRIKKDYENEAKKAGAKGKGAASKLRNLADKVRKSDTIDKILGKGKDIEGIDINAMGFTADKIKEAVAKVLEYMADGVEKGQAMLKALKETGGEKSKEFSDLIDRALLIATRPDRAASFELIKEQAKDLGAAEITTEMVKNVKDYVNSHIGDVSQKELIEEATKSLKDILPDVTKKQVIEAYLGEGDFKKPTKGDLTKTLEAKKRELQKLAKNEATEDEAQKRKLEDEKKKVKSEIQKLDRDIREGNFEEPKPPTVLKKQDAELIKLNKEKKNLEVEFGKYKRGIEEKNKSKFERVADFIRNTYVAFLIGGMKTFGKVGAMAMIRPFSEALTKQTAGRAFDLLFPNISKAAKRGGESNSIKAMTSGFGAYFRQMGEKKLNAVFDNARQQYEVANKKYEDAKSAGANEKELSSLKNDMQNKLLNALGNLQYKFIGGSSFKDAAKALINRANEIEASFGGMDTESIKDGNWLDKTNYVLGFVGRSHSALKTFSGRYSFASGLMARIEAAVKGGEEMTTEKVIELAHESYIDFERGKYQQENAITRWWNTHVLGNQKDPRHPEWENVNKGIRQLIKGDVAITRVPVNIIHEAVMEYTIGAFRAIYMAAKQKGLAKKAAEIEGLTGKDMENRIRESLANMDADKAATIARCFRKGGVGLGLYAFASLVSFGGFQYFGQRKKKDEDKLMEGELNPGQVAIGGKPLSELESGMIEHTPAFYPLLMGKGIAYMYNQKVAKGESTPKAAGEALLNHLKSLEGHIPQSKIISPIRVISGIIKSVEKRGEEYGLIDEDKRDYQNSSKPEKPSNPLEEKKKEIQKKKKEIRDAIKKRMGVH